MNTSHALGHTINDVPLFGLNAPHLSLMGIRFETDPPAGENPAGSNPPADPPAEPATPNPTPDAKPAVKFEDLDATTQKHILDLREGEKQQRLAAKKAEEDKNNVAAQLKAVTDALGITKADETPDAEKLTAQLAAVQAQADAQRRENAVLLSASTAGADATKLLDSRAFVKVLDGLDPNDTAALNTAITDWVQKHPDTKIATATPTSGTGGQGAGGSSATPRAGKLEDAVKSAMAARRP